MSDPAESDENVQEEQEIDSTGEPMDIVARSADDEKVNEGVQTGAALAGMHEGELFAGLDVGKIMSSYDYAQYMSSMSAFLVDFSERLPKLDSAIFETMSNIDFGVKPIMDAAVLKSLENVIDTKSMFPPGFFDKILDFKFPELHLHPETLRAIEALAVPARSKEIVTIDDAGEVIEGELIEEESENVIEIVPLFANQQLALQQRTVELLEQSLEATTEANRRADTERENASRAHKQNVAFVIAGLAIAVVGILVGVLVPG